MEEEENEYFPECERQWGEEKLETLGEKLQEAYAKLENRKGTKRRAHSSRTAARRTPVARIPEIEDRVLI